MRLTQEQTQETSMEKPLELQDDVKEVISQLIREQAELEKKVLELSTKINTSYAAGKTDDAQVFEDEYFNVMARIQEKLNTRREKEIQLKNQASR